MIKDFKSFEFPKEKENEELDKGESCEKCEEENENQKVKKEPYQPKWPKILSNRSDKEGNIPLRKEDDELKKAA